MEKKIYIKEWLELKPYDNQTGTDGYYLKLSNAVKQAIKTNKQSVFLQVYLDDEELNSLACFLTSYFEDLISGTNIWNTFVKIHQRLYKKQLPFYILDDYYEGEINLQDISFLIWYYINTVQHEKFVAPFNDFIVETAEKIMDVFDEAWEYAPENTTLKSFYHIDEKETDFYVCRTLIDTILFKSYLFYPDTSLNMGDQGHEIMEKFNGENHDHILSALNEMRDNLLHKAHTRLLGLNGKDWAADILGKDHPLYDDFINISPKINGFFLYKGEDDHYIYIEHIASGKKFDLLKDSFNYSQSIKTDTILYLGIVKWRSEWWFSGVSFRQPFDADLILDEKNSIEKRASVNFIDHQSEATNELLEMQFKAFKEFNNGSQIAFMPSEKIMDFSKRYIDFFNDKLNLSEKEVEEAKQRAKNDGFLGNDDELGNLSGIAETGLVFFNPKSGVEVALGVNSAFPLADNPYFVKEHSEEHILHLLLDKSMSTELVRFCIDNCKAKLPFFKKGVGKMYLDDIDFLLRFWKIDNYHTKPEITYTGKE